MLDSGVAPECRLNSGRNFHIMKKIITSALALFILCGCASSTAASTASAEADASTTPAETTAAETSAPAEAPAETDTVSSATDQGKGLRFGFYEQSDADKQATVLEYLNGNNGSYRNMMQMATASLSGVPTVSSVEFVLDPENFNLYGLSEAGTQKTLDLAQNPLCSVYWTRQLRPEEEQAGLTYFSSYGVQFTGTAHIFTVDELHEDPTELIHLFDTYYPTMPMTAAVWAKQENDEQKAAYIEQVLSQQVVYKVVPEKIVITQPYMLFMGAQSACAAFTTKTDNGYAYPFLSEGFLDQMIKDKLDDEAYKAMIDQVYPETEITDDMSEGDKTKAEQINASREILLGENTCGIVTQEILTNFTPAE